MCACTHLAGKFKQLNQDDRCLQNKHFLTTKKLNKAKKQLFTAIKNILLLLVVLVAVFFTSIIRGKVFQFLDIIWLFLQTDHKQNVRNWSKHMLFKDSRITN